MFPNPTQNELRLISNQIIDKISIIDINGRLLKSIVASDMNYSIDISSFSKGIYFIEIQFGEFKSTKKFIKNEVNNRIEKKTFQDYILKGFFIAIRFPTFKKTNYSCSKKFSPVPFLVLKLQQ